MAFFSSHRKGHTADLKFLGQDTQHVVMGLELRYAKSSAVNMKAVGAVARLTSK